MRSPDPAYGVCVRALRRLCHSHRRHERYDGAMLTSRHAIVVIGNDADLRIGLDRAAELSGMHPEMILEFVRVELVHGVQPGSDGMPRFHNVDVDRLRQIQHLRNEQHVNFRTIFHIMRLLDELEAALGKLRAHQEGSAS